MFSTNNPLAPFIKGEFFKSPLEKGDQGGCLVCYATNFEIPILKYKFGMSTVPVDK